MKLTKEQIIELKQMRAGHSVRELQSMFHISASTILYHINEKTNKMQKERVINNYKKLNPEQRHEVYLKKKDYQAKYFKNRYHTDEEFRRKVIETSKRFQKKRLTKE